ncbi:hypothetical protein Taro_017802 [Colocasia esculenta]|uniref:Uncharacterized protein n=1 Tax=Colocasia esculenta TaxID=4460 RepID=A0A843UP62_COLES|nr:hypothetical protein [Colocasia esculenta]
MFDSAGSAGVVLGPTLVVGRVLLPLLSEFLLLWLVRHWLSLLSLVREAHPPTLFRWLAFQQGPSVSCRRLLLLLLGAHAASVVAVFVRAAVGFVLGLRIHVGLSRRLRESTCSVAFTGVCPCWMSPLLLGCVLCLALCACAPLGAVLCSVGVFARAKQILVCHVAPLVERCDTCLWLLPALCWLVVNSGEVLQEFFSVGFGRGEVFPKTVLCTFLVVAALPSGLRCIAWLLCSGVI